LEAPVSEIPALQAIDIHKSFGDVEVLKGISLTAHRGDVVSILGSSGSGKSTFLRCLNFLEMPDRGEVRVAGEVVQIKEKKGTRAPLEPGMTALQPFLADTMPYETCSRSSLVISSKMHSHQGAWSPR